MILSNRSAFLEAARNCKGSVVVGSILDLHFPDGNGLFSMEAGLLARLLNSAAEGSLQVLKMRHVFLTGDMNALLAALIRQRKLKRFQAEFCSFPYRIAAEISSLPALTTFNIVGHKRFYRRRPLPVEMVAPLLERGRLKDLRLDNMLHLRQQSARDFFRALSKSRLEVFWCLASNFGGAEVALVAQLLQETPSLRDVRFSIASSNVSNVQQISQALESNQTLTHLGIRVAGQEDPTASDMKSFLEILQNHNCTLQDLILARGTQWDADQRRHIPVYETEQAAQLFQKIDFYLTLNRSGRAALLQDTAAPEDWLAAIASQWNLSLIFYLLTLNPQLLLGGGIPPPSTQTKARDEAVLLQRFSTLFPEALRNGTLHLLGPRQVQDALLCLLPNCTTPIRNLSIRFVERATLVDLAFLIERCGPQLETILLEQVELQQNTNNKDCSLLKALSNATNLMHLSIRNCTCDVLEAGEWMTVLSELPQFESLGWTGNENASLTFGALHQLLGKEQKPLKFLAMDRVVVEDDDEGAALDTFFRLLQQSTSLKVLRCETDPQGVSSLTPLAQALAQNQSLENLQIHVTSDVDLEPLAEALRSNRTLTGLHITGLERPDLSAFASVLETSNSTLKSFLIGKQDLGEAVMGDWQRIRLLLRANIARSRPAPLPRACYNPV